MELVEVITFVTEWIGTIAFAVSGAMTGIGKKLDLLGVIVLSIVTAVGGGAIRDILLGQVPPVMFQTPVYIALAAASSVAVFTIVWLAGDKLGRHKAGYDSVLNLADAVGLGVFATAGVDMVQKLGYKNDFFMAVFMGTITAVGGGILRDVMVCSIPMVLRKRVYAMAAIIGSSIYYVLLTAGINRPKALAVSVVLVAAIRLLAAKYGWNLPKAPAIAWADKTTDQKKDSNIK